MFYASIIEQVPDLKVIRSIKDEIAARNERFDIGVVDVGDDGFDGDTGIDLPNTRSGRHGLWQALYSIGFFEKGLSLKVCKLYEIAINDPQVADTGAREHLRVGCSESSAAHDQNAGIKQSLLPVAAYLPKEDLPAVSLTCLVFLIRTEGTHSFSLLS